MLKETTIPGEKPQTNPKLNNTCTHTLRVLLEAVSINGLTLKETTIPGEKPQTNPKLNNTCTHTLRLLLAAVSINGLTLKETTIPGEKPQTNLKLNTCIHAAKAAFGCCEYQWVNVEGNHNT